MKITLSINLGGYSFNIDEDAYDELRAYLRKLEQHFAGEESSSEILSDIETRIAEIFRTKLTGYRQVITMQDVNEAVSILGNPEVIGESTGPSAGEKFSTPGYHRMYRDPDNRILGGICSGMGAYWHIEPWIIRVLFFVLTIAGGLGILVYLILWVVLPEARTTAQKIEMKGDPVNIENIKESVKKEVENVRKKMNI
ncbi:MAG TPA: PspC domain-containing protein [Bacteroidales bacterium]|nr:PspC domain-containing protein [Bacteroidales bacterium]